MAKVIIQELNHRRKAIQTHKFDKFPVTIGRGYRNDLILGDNYVCPHHACIDQGEEGWLIHNLASKNGVFIQNRQQDVTDTAPLHSGDILVLGKTQLKVVSPNHQVPESRKVQIPQDRRVQWRIPLLAWGLTWVCILLIVFDVYQGIGEKELSNELIETTIMLLVVMALVFVWSAAWAFIGRVLKHKTQFHLHLLMAVASLILLDITLYANTFIGYNTCTPAIRNFVENLLPILIFGSLFALSIQTATAAPKQPIYLISAMVVGLCIAVVIYAQINRQKEFSPSPEFDAVLLAPWAQVNQGQSLEQFMQANERLFQNLEP